MKVYQGLAKAFAAEGATVALWDRDPDTLAEAVKTVAADGGEAHGIEVDVADVASIATAAAETLRLLIPRLERKSDRSWRDRIEAGVADWWKVMEARAMNEADPLNPQPHAVAGECQGT